MTVTERNYRKHIGKLYWSRNRNSLVTIEGIKRSEFGNRWKYIIYYSDPAVGQQSRSVNCIRVIEMIGSREWQPADQYIKNQPPLSSEK